MRSLLLPKCEGPHSVRFKLVKSISMSVKLVVAIYSILDYICIIPSNYQPSAIVESSSSWYVCITTNFSDHKTCTAIAGFQHAVQISKLDTTAAFDQVDTLYMNSVHIRNMRHPWLWLSESGAHLERNRLQEFESWQCRKHYISHVHSIV